MRGMRPRGAPRGLRKPGSSPCVADPLAPRAEFRGWPLPTRHERSAGAPVAQTTDRCGQLPCSPLVSNVLIRADPTAATLAFSARAERTSGERSTNSSPYGSSSTVLSSRPSSVMTAASGSAVAFFLAALRRAFGLTAVAAGAAFGFGLGASEYNK